VGKKIHEHSFRCSLAEPSNNDGCGRKNPLEETNSSLSESTEDPDALRESQHLTGIVLPHYNRHSEETPRWYLEISRDPCQVSSHNEAIGLGSFFKCQPYDYTDNELNLPQGHEDHIHMVDLLPTDRKRREDEDDASDVPTDWVEHTEATHHSLSRSFGPGTWKCVMMGDLMT